MGPQHRGIVQRAEVVQAVIPSLLTYVRTYLLAYLLTYYLLHAPARVELDVLLAPAAHAQHGVDHVEVARVVGVPG